MAINSGPRKTRQPTVLSPAQVERRRTIRILYRDLKVKYDGCTEWADARSPDLSTQGMFINTPHEFLTGAHLKLRFDLLRSGVCLQVVGEVRYCLPGMGVGVEFVNLPEYARAAIQEEVEDQGEAE